MTETEALLVTGWATSGWEVDMFACCRLAPNDLSVAFARQRLSHAADLYMRPRFLTHALKRSLLSPPWSGLCSKGSKGSHYGPLKPLDYFRMWKKERLSFTTCEEKKNWGSGLWWLSLSRHGPNCCYKKSTGITTPRPRLPFHYLSICLLLFRAVFLFYLPLTSCSLVRSKIHLCSPSSLRSFSLPFLHISNPPPHPHIDISCLFPPFSIRCFHVCYN